jgi:hypothetical protein
MREIEMALDTIEHIAGQMRIAAPMFEQFPFLNSINVMREEECLGQIERCDDFVEGCRFVLNAYFFEVPNEFRI